MDDPRGELDSHHPKAMHERRARRDWRRRGSRMALALKSKSAILLTTSPLRVVLFTWSLHSQSIDGSIGPSGACKTRKDVAAIALTVSERSEPIILQILIEQTPRAAKIVKSPAKTAGQAPSNFASPEQFGDNPMVLFPRDYLPCVKVPKYH